MKKLSLLVILTASLSGCSTLVGWVDKGAKVNDEAVTAAEFTICRGASVGSIRRHYSTAERSKLWQELCKGYENSEFSLQEPSDEN